MAVSRVAALLCVLAGTLLLNAYVHAQPPAQAAAGDGEQARRTSKTSTPDDVLTAMNLLSDKIRAAQVSRATVELTSRAKVGDQQLSNEKSVYQIASKSPNLYTAYYKSEGQSFRIFCNGEQSSVLMSPTDYCKSEVPTTMAEAVTSVPVPLGPYPEPVLALTLCGVDPAHTFLADMQSVEVVDRTPVANSPAVHIRGVQVDGVTWDLWISTKPGQVQPLRLLVELGEMLRSNADAPLPENFSYELDCRFPLWRMEGEVDPGLFVLKPPANAVEHESYEAYHQSLAEQNVAHELLGKAAPDFELAQFNHEKPDAESEQTIKLSSLKGKVVVLDFWASWCAPCIEAMPIVYDLTAKYNDQQVVFLAVNAGDTATEIAEFFKDKAFRPDVLLDLDGKVADLYKADAIPQTVVVGKDGRVEIVHVGYASLDAFKKELAEQLDLLVTGGTLLPVEEKSSR